MRIVIDVVLDAGNNQVGVHCFHTERVAWNQVPTPGNPVVPMDAVDYLKLLHTTPALILGSGWDILSNHPTYPGKTRLQVVLLEIVRVNDAVTRALLGV